MVWKPNEDWSGRELDKVWPFLVPYTRGRVLDVGSGQRHTFKHWITLDSGMDYGGSRVADVQADGKTDVPFADNTFDAVVSSHFLEHCENWQNAIGLWWRKVKVGGHLVLYWPHPDHYPRVGEPGANPDHKHDIDPGAVKALMEVMAGGWDCLEDETRAEGSEYSQFQVWRKRKDRAQNYRPWRRTQKSVLVIRYGAIGDQIVAASILPLLKRDGWHVTYNTSTEAATVTEHDPHIDAFLLQDKDQVPNENLGPYWQALATRYDRVINLCESVEGTLLTLPGRANDQYPLTVRHRLCNINYLEFTHDLAGVAHEFNARFYPTDAEVAQSLAIRKQNVGEGRLLLWAIRGSSVHKVWPYMMQAVVRLLNAHPDLHVMLTGDASAKQMEDCIIEAVADYCGLGATQRMMRSCGLLPIRAAMTFACRAADVVVGQETGVLNAAAFEPVPKVVFLSHSTQENLTKHWVNTRVLEADVPCRPCHRLHYSWDRCAKDAKTATAACQAAIPVDAAVSAITAALTDAAQTASRNTSEAEVIALPEKRAAGA